MNGTEKKHISILGSCICRDIFGFHENDGGYIIDGFVQSVSPLSIATRNGIKEDDIHFTDIISACKKMPHFYKRCMTLEYAGQVVDYVGKKKSDFLVIDMADIRFELYNLAGNFYSSGMVKLAKYQYFTEQDPVIDQLFSSDKTDPLDLSDNVFYSLLDQYLVKIRKYYPQEKLILIEDRAVYQFISDSELVFCRETLEEYKKWNQRIEKAFLYVKEKLPRAHVVRFPVDTVGNLHHKWGFLGFHYIDEYYDYAQEAINIIVGHNADREAENDKLDQLYDLYVEKIWRVYNASVQKYAITAENNSLRSKRIEAYEKWFLELLIQGDSKKKIREFFLKNHFSSCCIYGATEPVRYLLPVIEGFVKVKYMVENGRKKYKDIPCIPRNSGEYPFVDVIVIADIVEQEKIRSKLEKLQLNIPIYDICQLAEGQEA